MKEHSSTFEKGVQTGNTSSILSSAMARLSRTRRLVFWVKREFTFWCSLLDSSPGMAIVVAFPVFMTAAFALLFAFWCWRQL
jgi:hypothetical protein